jgi:hypothetical protein
VVEDFLIVAASLFQGVGEDSKPIGIQKARG